MKKVLLSLLFCVSLVQFAKSESGDFYSPRDRDGAYAEGLDLVGVYVFTSSFTTTPIMAVKTSTLAIYGVLTGTRAIAAEQAFVSLRCTDTANTSSELIVPPIMFSSTTRNTFIEFKPPIVCAKGLSVDTSSNTVIASVFYRSLVTNTTEDFYIPDGATDIKTKSAQFFGVAVASEVAVGGVDADKVGADVLDFTTGRMLLRGTTVFASPSLLYGIISGTTTSTISTMYETFQDTGSTVNSGTLPFALPPLYYTTMTFEDALQSGDKTKSWFFPWPVIFNQGIVAQNSVSTNRLRVLTRPRRSTR